MTTEDAIYEIKQLAVLSTNKNIDRITEALEMAIDALDKIEYVNKQLGRAEQIKVKKPCANCEYHGWIWDEHFGYGSVCKGIGRCPHNVEMITNKSKDEPQTDCPWK